jgi:PAS domain S-box-containing protein
MRSAASAALISLILAVCLSLPLIDHATVALVLVAATVGVASVWGGWEALAGALIGGLGYDYYFLPPVGLQIAKPEHVVALAVFVFAALAAGQLAARSRTLLEQRDSLLSLSLDPLCVADRSGSLRSNNEAMVGLLGWTREELSAMKMLELVHPNDRAHTEAAFRDFWEAGRVVEVENRYRTKSGGWRWLHWKVAPPAPGASWFAAAARDITKERWAQDKLRNLAAQVMTAQEDERRRIAGELHDDITQRLATIGIEVGLLRKNPSAAELTGDLNRLQSQIFDLAERIRGVSHSIHPGILEHADLVASLEAHCREFSGQHSIAAHFKARGVLDRVPPAIALSLYRIVQESLRNVARHSGATSVSVVLEHSEGELSLSVIDNGGGFDPNTAKTRPGLGLVSIEERARQIGAVVTIDSILGAGTAVQVKVDPR